MRSLVGLATVLTACYHPHPEAGAPCGPGGACPESQHCDFGQTPPTCVPGGGSGNDGSVGDGLSDGSEQQCAADSDCTAGACIEATGTCVDDSHVIFLSPQGMDTGACLRVAPCKTFAYAFTLLTPTVTMIRVGDGSYEGGAVLTVGANVTQVVISGEDRDPAGATIMNLATSPALSFSDNTDVLVEGVTITSAGDALLSRQSLTVSHVHATGGTEGVNLIGPNGGGGMLRIADSRIDGGGARGVLSNRATVEIERTYVIGNAGGGIRLQNGGLTLYNSVVAKNGSATAIFGGVRVDSPPAGGVSFVHDTVAYNQVAAGSTHSAGVDSGGGFTVSNSILADNGPNGSDQMSAMITVRYSLFEGGPAPVNNMGNIQGTPAFRDVVGGDFHITASSEAIDAGEPSALTEDIDGQLRPFGAGPDMGADEYHP